MNGVHKFNIVNILGVKMATYSKAVIFFLLLISFNINGQSTELIDDYIKEGLKNNIVLKQKKISYEKALVSLKSATSLFFPTVEIIATYTHGEGGRNISIPVGDLMNPVYQTLNQLTNSNAFPKISNVEESFFPNKFYDAKIRASMPILNTDIIYNREIKERETEIKEHEVELYKKELIKEIKTAYYNFLSSLEAVRIYKSSQELAHEAKRVNESLFKNGAGLHVYVMRAESEIEDLNSMLADAETKSMSAKKYFNFLLNRTLEERIETATIKEPNEPAETEKDFISLREELKMLNGAAEINKSILSMNKSFWIPKVSAFIDLGTQDSNWKYSSKSRYHLFGVQLEFPIFEAFRNINKIELASLDVQETELEIDQTQKALSLAFSISKEELKTSLKNYSSALKQLKTAEAYNKLIEKGYKEGANSFIETVDARNQLTSAKLLANIKKYAAHIAKAKFEREALINKVISN